jgi:dATP pyrophosphohydrolase
MNISRSFGVIPIYKSENTFHTTIVQNSKGGHWGLPKGTPEDNESASETALRELKEETGIEKVVLTDTTFQEEYSFENDGTNYHKINTYFVGFVDNMTSSDDLDEINECKWVTFDDAVDLLTHESAKKIVRDVASYVLRSASNFEG